jgi:hypothetical protein
MQCFETEPFPFVQVGSISLAWTYEVYHPTDVERDMYQRCVQEELGATYADASVQPTDAASSKPESEPEREPVPVERREEEVQPRLGWYFYKT